MNLNYYVPEQIQKPVLQKIKIHFKLSAYPEQLVNLYVYIGMSLSLANIILETLTTLQ